MKKTVVTIIIFTLVLYLLPVITLGMTKSDEISASENLPVVKTEIPEESTDVDKKPSFDEKTVVTVLRGGEKESMNLREYLIGTVAAEMPASFPEEALKAQAVAARSYALYKIENDKNNPKHAGADLCDDASHCAAFFDIKSQGKSFWGNNEKEYAERIEAAVKSTDGVVAACDGKVIAAVFHSASSEITEAAASVWGDDYSYLKSVESPGGDDAPDYYGTVAVKLEDFTSVIKNRYKNADFSGPAALWFGETTRSPAGGVITLECGKTVIKGTEIRELFGLNSTNFKIEVTQNEVIFTTKGRGHGVGLSQYGARYMALSGATFDEIIKHYYNGVELMIKK